MSIFFNNWKYEPSDGEKFTEITGEETTEPAKDIERKIGDAYTTRSERKKLMDLQAEIEHRGYVGDNTEPPENRTQ